MFIKSVSCYCNSVVGKVVKLIEFVRQQVANIVALYETKLRGENKINFLGFDVEKRDGRNSQRGAALVIKNGIDLSNSTLAALELIAVQLAGDTVVGMHSSLRRKISTANLELIFTLEFFLRATLIQRIVFGGIT